MGQRFPLVRRVLGTLLRAAGRKHCRWGLAGLCLLPASAVAGVTAAAIAGQTVTLRASAAGTAPLEYRWEKNGQPLPGANSPTLVLATVTPADAGEYVAIIANPAGSAVTANARVEVLPVAPESVTAGSQSSLANLSVRGFTGAGADILIAGVVIRGADARQVLVRAMGPTLGALGVRGALADPRLKVFRSGNLVAENEDWPEAPGDPAAVASRVGALALEPGSRDAALVLRLPPGGSTAHVDAADGSTGVAMLEFYDAENTDVDPPPVANLSSRARVGDGDDLLIAGFVIRGVGARRLLIRGLGPALARQDVPDTLPDPELRLFHGSEQIWSSDDWGADGAAAEVAAAGAAVGAFPLDAGSRDAAFVITLPPGVYTVHLDGVNASSGVGLVELYDLAK